MKIKLFNFIWPHEIVQSNYNIISDRIDTIDISPSVYTNHRSFSCDCYENFVMRIQSVEKDKIFYSEFIFINFNQKFNVTY